VKVPLALALACLAVAGSGCDAVFGDLSIPTRPTYFGAASQDSGANPTGKVHWLLCCTRDYEVKVTCLRVEGNRATVGTDWPDPYNPVGHLWYVEDNPGQDDDRFLEGTTDSPPTSCPAPPTSFPADSAYSGDVHVVNDYHP
jgi:hypothetical protein